VSTPLVVGPDQVRGLFLHAQGLRGAPPRGRPVERVDAMLRGVLGVQLDTISVLARSHELVAYARLGAVGRAAVDTAYWGRGRSWEYWAHAACLLPVESWPWLAYKRRRYAAGVEAGGRVAPAVRAEALARVRDSGPLTAADLGGARRGGPWWDWSPLKRGVEELLAAGVVVCTERRGWRRVYDLAERAIPAPLLAQDPSDEESLAWMCREAALRLGVATLPEIADYFRLLLGSARRGLAGAGLLPVTVRGWDQPAFVHPDHLALLDAPPRGRHRTTLLSPFDSLVWDRRRTERIFAFTHRLEAYVPRPQRVHGYFTMPLLAGGRLRGRVDPARSGRTLVARRVSVEAAAVEDMAAALAEAATWVGCDAVAVEVVEPASLRRSLEAALRRVA
jgi:uncharacterized protein